MTDINQKNNTYKFQIAREPLYTQILQYELYRIKYHKKIKYKLEHTCRWDNESYTSNTPTAICKYCGDAIGVVSMLRKTQRKIKLLVENNHTDSSEYGYQLKKEKIFWANVIPLVNNEYDGELRAKFTYSNPH